MDISAENLKLQVLVKTILLTLVPLCLNNILIPEGNSREISWDFIWTKDSHGTHLLSTKMVSL